MKLHLWQISYIVGLAIVVPLLLLDLLGIHLLPETIVPYLELLGGILLIAGSCEAFVICVEGIAHNMHLTDYVAGIYASIASTIPELFVLIFLILGGQYEMAWILALATIFMNSLVFALYTLVLPKDEEGNFRLPDAIHHVGSDLLTMGSVISLSVAFSMILVHIFPLTAGNVLIPQFLNSSELILFGLCLIFVFAAYLYRITKYYGKCDPTSDDPHVACEIQHDVMPKKALAITLLFAVVGAALGGEALSSFAHFAIDTIQLPIIYAALLLVMFGGTPEYIIVASSHRKDELEVALSNAFGGIVQVFFVIFGFTMVMSGVMGYFDPVAQGLNILPIELYSVVLLLFAFPTMFILRAMITDDAKINALESVSMIAVFIMMLYILLFYGGI
ncbi:MAG: sodium/calcium exchanger protein [Candidatus Thorarchaeota archaeon]